MGTIDNNCDSNETHFSAEGTGADVSLALFLVLKLFPFQGNSSLQFETIDIHTAFHIFWVLSVA